MTQIDRINGLIGSIAVKAPCRAATTVNITLSGEQTIDGVTVIAEDRVLVKNQTITSENGIYDVSATSWSRATDFNGKRDFTKGTLVRAIEGTINANINFEVISSGTTIDVSSIVFNGEIIASDVTYYANITALRAIATAPSITNATTKGYTTDNDGGQGDWYWDSTSTETDNGGTIIKATAITTGRWKRLYSGAVYGAWFGTVGASDDSAALEDAFAASTEVEIPYGTTVTIDSTITLTNAQTLIVNGTLNGSGNILADASFTLIGKGNIAILTPSNYNITFRGGAAIAGGGLTFNGSGYGIGVRPTINITRLEFDNIVFDGMNYGILRNIGTVDVFDATISNIKAVNMTGDPIEWNLGNGDRRLTIHDIFIHNVDATLTNQGIGVGVAGGSYDLAFSDNMEQFEIYNIFASALRQAVHVEAAQYFKIHDIYLTDISSAYSTAAGLDIRGVAIYGCRNFEIYNVYGNGFTGANIIGITPGVSASVYTYPNYNYKIHDVYADNAGKIVAVAHGQDGYCQVSDITALNGSTIELYGKVSYWDIKDINVLTAAKTDGFTFDYSDSVYNGTSLNATKNLSVVMSKVNVRDTLGEPYTTLTNFTPEHLDASGCNFTIETTKSNRKQCQRIFYIDAGTFPYGIEYQVGDLIHDIGGTPQQHLVTTEGSRNRGADTCEVYDQANKLLKSTNLAWTDLSSGGQHEIGQNITISNIGAGPGNLVTRVVRVFLDGGFYQIEVEDAITAVDTTAGTITATNAVAYTSIT